MLKVLIVDDEPIHIQGIIQHTHWSDLGYEAPLSAESGTEALHILSRMTVDVLITDVSMPEMTGIELIAKCKADLPHLNHMQAIMISGYNEFEFVQDAIHVGAQGYVLKPIKIDELENKLEYLSKTIVKIKQIEEETHCLQKKVDGSLELVRERFVCDLLESSELSSETERSWSTLLELPELNAGIRVTVFGYDDFLSNGDDARQRVIRAAGFQKAIHVGISDATHVYSAKTRMDEVTALHLEASPYAFAQMEKQFVLIQNIVQEQFNATMTIGVSRQCYKWEEVQLAYKEVKFMMACARMISNGQIIYYDQLNKQEFQEYRLRDEFIPRIVKLVESGDIQEISNYFYQVYDLLVSQEQMSFSYIQAFGMGLLSELARKQKGSVQQAGEMNILMWQRLIDCKKPEESREVIFEYLSQFMVLAQQDREGRQHHLIQTIAEYIESHIQENVTVKQLADTHHLNSSYLSVLFKREMNKTISDYVQEVRLRKAKELLCDPNIKVYEVAERVGFQTSSYFTYLFKKLTGITPQQFRDYHYN